MSEEAPLQEASVDLSSKPDLYSLRKFDDLQKQIKDLNAEVVKNTTWLERMDKEKEHSFNKKRIDHMLYGIIAAFLIGVAGIILTLWQLYGP